MISRRNFLIKSALFAGVMLSETGCVSVPEIPFLENNTQTIPLQEIATNIKSRLPIVKKASFGTVKIVGIGLQAGAKPGRLEIPVRFVLTSYEIPEGIEGMVVYEGGLRYSPTDRSLYLDGLKPMRLVFGNASLQEYVSAAAKRGIAGVIASELTALPIKRMPSAFHAKGIKGFTLDKGVLSVSFE